MDGIVLIAETPLAPPSIAALAGSVISKISGVILAHIGKSVTSATQPVTSLAISGFCPIAAPIPSSGCP